MGTMYFPMYDSAVNRLYIGCASSEACVQGGAFQYFCLLLPVFGGFLAGYSNYNPDIFLLADSIGISAALKIRCFKYR